MTETPDDSDFTDEFCAFLQNSVATVDAAELLLQLAQHRDKYWLVRDLVAKVSVAGTLAETDAEKYLDALDSRGLVERAADGRVRYRSSVTDEAHVATLHKLYVERPVTLFRVIYALRDTKIKTLADAFRIFRK